MITVAAVFAFRSLSLYSIHMFQLSSYKRRDYRKWLSENMPRQNIIPTTTGFSFVCMFFTILYRNYVYTRSFTVMCAVIAVVAAVFAFFLADGIAGGYRFIEKAGAKKPLPFIFPTEGSSGRPGGAFMQPSSTHGPDSVYYNVFSYIDLARGEGGRKFLHQGREKKACFDPGKGTHSDRYHWLLRKDFGQIFPS